MKLTNRELATVLHALRAVQEKLAPPVQGATTPPPCYGDEDGMCGHFDDATPLSADEIDALCENLNEIGSLSTDDDIAIVNEVPCAVCHRYCSATNAHLHQGAYIGDECCWDERLKASE